MTASLGLQCPQCWAVHLLERAVDRPSQCHRCGYLFDGIVRRFGTLEIERAIDAWLEDRSEGDDRTLRYFRHGPEIPIDERSVVHLVSIRKTLTGAGRDYWGAAARALGWFDLPKG